GASGTTAFSVNVPAGATYVVQVVEVSSNVFCSSYTLQLSGLPCPSPTLNIAEVPVDNAHLFWTNSAGGYQLESAASVAPASWAPVTNEPLISGGNFHVTNSAVVPTNRFYRLHKQ